MITIVITKLRDTVTAALLEDGRVREFQPEPRETSLVGNIYTGRVKHILRNIEAAFVEFAPAKTGYLSLRDNGLADLREGAELAVQVEKDAVKTKEPVLTANLSFSGRYTVVTAVRRQRALSARITDNEERERLREILEKYDHPEFGIIARTEAAGVPEEMILAEAESLTSEARSVLEKILHQDAGNPSVQCRTFLYPHHPGESQEYGAHHHGYSGMPGQNPGVPQAGSAGAGRQVRVL